MAAAGSKNEGAEDIPPQFQEAHRLFEEHGVTEALKKITQELEGWKDVEVKIGVTGMSGVGKSTFINTLRSLEDDDEGAAFTDVVEVICTEPKAYPFPSNEKVTLWDLPGIGTPTYPDLNTYCEKVDLKSYDAFLILTATRFTMFELLLAQKIKEMKRSFFFIRTKLDMDEINDKRKKDHSIEKMETKIRADCHKGMEGLGLRHNEIFLVSNVDAERWDFEKLFDAIVGALTDFQNQALTRSVKIKSRWVLDRKKALLKDETGKVLFLFIPAGVLDVVSFGFVSHTINWFEVKRRLECYRSELGLPKKDTKKYKQLNETLKSKMEKFYLGGGGKEFCKTYFGCKLKFPFYITWKTATDTKEALDKYLDDIAEVSCEISVSEYENMLKSRNQYLLV